MVATSRNGLLGQVRTGTVERSAWQSETDKQGNPSWRLYTLCHWNDFWRCHEPEKDWSLTQQMLVNFSPVLVSLTHLMIGTDMVGRSRKRWNQYLLLTKVFFFQMTCPFSKGIQKKEPSSPMLRPFTPILASFMHLEDTLSKSSAANLLPVRINTTGHNVTLSMSSALARARKPCTNILYHSLPGCLKYFQDSFKLHLTLKSRPPLGSRIASTAVHWVGHTRVFQYYGIY